MDMDLEVHLIMESRSLQHRLRQRRDQERKNALLILLAFALVLGLWLWYCFVYTRTPEYAAKSVAEACARHDASTVQYYVNLDRTLSRAYDDLTDDMLRYDAALTAENKVQYEQFYDIIKPQMLEGVREVLAHYIETGEWTLPQGASLTKGRQLGIDFERFLERSQIRNVEFVNVESARVVGDTADVQIAVRDRVTEIPFSLRLRMERAQDGHWQVIRMENYKLYLDALATKQNRDIADYIAATYDLVTSYNQQLEAQRARFASLARQANGVFFGDTAAAVVALIENETIPTLKERQNQLDAVAIPRGAAYLANLRHTSTDLSIAAWTHYLKGIATGESEEYNTAETLLKQEMEIELRITDIIRHNTVSQALPDIP